MNAKISLEKLILIKYLWLHQPNCLKVQIIKLNCIVDINNIEKIIATYFDLEDDKISGGRIEVKINEFKFEKRKYNRGHQIEGVLILRGIEITPQIKLFLRIMSDRRRETFQTIIKKYTKFGSIIVPFTGEFI